MDVELNKHIQYILGEGSLPPNKVKSFLKKQVGVQVDLCIHEASIHRSPVETDYTNTEIHGSTEDSCPRRSRQFLKAQMD